MYLEQLIDDRCGQAAVIDPSPDLVRYGALLRDGSLRLCYVIDARAPGPTPVARLLATNYGAELWAHPAAGASERVLGDSAEGGEQR